MTFDLKTYRYRTDLFTQTLRNFTIGLVTKRSESSSNAKCRLRFSILMEAYCRGSVTSIKPLLKQFDAIHVLSTLSSSIKKNNENLSATFIMVLCLITCDN